MLSGFYTIASGMLASQRNIDTIGNNLENLQTPGYRGERVINSSFDQTLMSRIEARGDQVLGDGIGSTVTVVDDAVSMFNMGNVKPTGRSLDFALNGDGFFNIRGEDGTTYLTKNGSFDIDDRGYLVLPGVGRVIGENGDILVKNSEFTVLEDGNIIDGDGRTLGKLSISTVNDKTELERTQDGLFIAQGATNATNYKVLQNYLELSNTDMNTELTNLIAAQRTFQNCSTALQMIDSLDRKAATQIASI